MRISDINPAAWIVENRIKASSGQPFDFKEHLFWYDVLNDVSPHQVWLKAAQGGGTEVAILKALWLCDRRKMDCIYTMPSQSDINTTVGTRLNRLLGLNPSLAALVKDKDSVEQKLVGDNLIHFRGTMTERAAISVPADCLIHDEEDRSNATVLPTYASRLQHSKYKWDWHFSNPSFPGHGVDRLWQKSDQKHWFIKCPKCSEDQYLSWPDSVNFERKQFVCKKCDAEIDTQTRRAGRWVKKWEDREYSGYWISALMYPWLTAEYIIKEFQERPQDYFFNFVLGLPYVAEGSTITKETILRNCQSVVMDQKRCVIGVDVGLDCHYVVGNRSGLFYHDKTSKQEEVEGLLHRWKDSIMVIDAGPDIFFVRELRDKYPGRVYLCSFARSRPKEEIIRWGKGEESGRVLADRSRVIQLVADEFAGRRIPLQGTAHDWEPFASHAAVMYRVQELDMSGNPVYTWESSSPMNHWFLASTYWRIGMDRFGGDVSFIQTSNIDQPPSAPTVFKGRIPSSYALDGKKIGQDEVW